MPRTVNNLFTTHGKDILSSGAERVYMGNARHLDESGKPSITSGRRRQQPTEPPDRPDVGPVRVRNSPRGGKG